MRIAWVGETDEHEKAAALFEEFGRMQPGKALGQFFFALSWRPDFLKAFRGALDVVSTDGELTRAQHDLIIAHVSALTHCHY